MTNLIELTAAIVSAHVSIKQMTSEEMILELQQVHQTLVKLEAIEAGVESEDQTKKLTLKQAFKKDEVLCMICGKGFKTLKRHLAQAHDLKPGQYRKQFGIPSSQSLSAKSYSESRRKAAEERGLGDILAKARIKRASGKKTTTSAATTKMQTVGKTAKPSAPTPVTKKKLATTKKTKPAKA